MRDSWPTTFLPGGEVAVLLRPLLLLLLLLWVLLELLLLRANHLELPRLNEVLPGAVKNGSWQPTPPALLQRQTAFLLPFLLPPLPPPPRPFLLSLQPHPPPRRTRRYPWHVLLLPLKGEDGREDGREEGPRWRRRRFPSIRSVD